MTGGSVQISSVIWRHCHLTRDGNLARLGVWRNAGEIRIFKVPCGFAELTLWSTLPREGVTAIACIGIRSSNLINSQD